MKVLWFFVFLLGAVQVQANEPIVIKKSSTFQRIFYGVEQMRNTLVSYNLAHGTNYKPLELHVTNYECRSSMMKYDWKLVLQVSAGEATELKGNYSGEGSCLVFTVLFQLDG